MYVAIVIILQSEVCLEGPVLEHKATGDTTCQAATSDDCVQYWSAHLSLATLLPIKPPANVSGN